MAITQWPAPAGGTGGADGGNILAAGTQTAGSTNSVKFADSNGITFGMSNSSVITATVRTNYQSSGAYLTTAALSQDSSKYAGTAGAITGGSITVNTSGVSVNLPAYLTTAQPPGAYLTTAALSQDSSKYAGVNGAITGGSITVNTSGVSVALPAYLTTAANSNHSHSLNQILSPSADVFFSFSQGQQIQFQFSNTGTFTTNAGKQGLFEIDVQGNLTAGADAVHIHQSDNDPQIDLLHLEGAGTNVTALRISASASVAMEINKPIKFIGTGAGNTASVPMILGTGQSNLVSNLNANYLQGKVSSEFQSTGAYLTTAANSTHTHGSGPSITGSISVTSNSSAWSISIPNFLTTAALSADSSKYAGTNGAITGGSITVNTSGVSVNLPAYLTTAAVSSHTHGSPSITGSISITSNSNAWSISIPSFLTTAALSADSSKYAGINGAITGGSITVNTSGVSVNLPAYLTTAQPVGAYLTTAALSGDTSKYAGINGAITGGSITVNTSGVSINLPAYLTTAQPVGAYLTTAALSGDTTKYAGVNGAITGGSITVNTSGVSVALPAYLTTAALSADSSKYAGLVSGFTGANASGSMTVNTSGVSLSLSVAAPGAAAENNWHTLLGNVAGNSSASGSTIAFSAGQGITISGTNNSQLVFSVGSYITTGAVSDHSHGNPTLALTNLSGTTASASNGLTLSLSAAAPGGGAGYTAYTYQNRQLGASTTLNSMGGQNSLWFIPFRIAAPVSASTILAAMVSYSGTITSSATAQAGQTLRVGIYSQLTDPASTSRFDTLWTGAASLTFWNSGTSSYSYAYSQSGGQTTGSSAGSNLGTANVMGVRHIILPIGSTIQTGLYMFGLVNSTSSAGYSAAMSRMALYMDNPMSVGAGTMGGATNNSFVYVDAGTYLTTTGGLPGTVAFNQTGGVANLVPYFKIGAI